MPRKGFITLLGSIIRCDGDLWPELTARVNKAWNYYFTFRYIFENKFVAFGTRIIVWEKTVQMVLLWALETCRLSTAQRKALYRCQNQMAARMLRISRKWSTGETFLEFAQRKSKFARWMIQQWSLPVSDRLLDNTFSWAGHVARMSIDRWAKRSILWRGCLWKKSGN